jgi:hypothetical protein
MPCPIKSAYLNFDITRKQLTADGYEHLKFESGIIEDFITLKIGKIINALLNNTNVYSNCLSFIRITVFQLLYHSMNQFSKRFANTNK